MSPEKAAKKAANLLVSAFKGIVSNDKTAGTGHFRAGPSGKSFMLTPESLAAISSAARKLVQFIDNFPLEKCIDQLTGYVVAEKDAGTPLPHVHERLRQKVLQFLQSFTSQGEWEVIYAVRGIDYSKGPFSLGQCGFYLMDDQHFALWGRRFATGRYDPPSDAPVSQTWVQLESALLNQLVAVSRVRATDQDHAREKGRSKIKEVINLLRYGQLAILHEFEAPFPEMGLSVQEVLDDHSVVIRLDKPSCGTNKSGGGTSGFPLANLRQAPGFNELETLIRLDPCDRNELGMRLTTALEWIGQAPLAPSRPIRLVALVTALEALLIEESETSGKRTKLAKRVSKLISQTDAEKPRLVKEIEELYKTRSECVHAGLADVEKAEIDRAVQLVAKTVEAILSTPPYCTADALADILVPRPD